MEKVSEMHIRKALTDKIRESGLREIEERKVYLKERIDDLDLKDEEDYRWFDCTVRELMWLNYLKDYLKGETMFGVNWAVGDDICYIIPTSDLEIWYEDGVMGKYLSFVEVNEINPCLLSDRFFSNGFVSIIDRMARDRINLIKNSAEIDKNIDFIMERAEGDERFNDLSDEEKTHAYKVIYKEMYRLMDDENLDYDDAVNKAINNFFQQLL